MATDHELSIDWTSNMIASGYHDVARRLSAVAGIATIAVALAPFAAHADDQVAGQRTFAARCASCHGTTPGAKRFGPTLAGVFGRASGSVDGFKYSPALKNAHLTWDSATLDKWLAGPRAWFTKRPCRSAFRATPIGRTLSPISSRCPGRADICRSRQRRMTMTILRINGTPHEIDADPQMPLLWAIRDIVGLTGTKFGCGIGACGACTVHLVGQAVRSCTTALADAEAMRSSRSRA
jgi:cytochrome c2